MSKLLTELLQKEKMLQELESEVKKLRGDDRLHHDLAFKEELEEVVSKYGKTAREAAAILDPQGVMGDISTSNEPRKKRALKVYKNPHTGEIVETRGGNNKTIRAWKDEHGDDEVSSWVVETKA